MIELKEKYECGHTVESKLTEWEIRKDIRPYEKAEEMIENGEGTLEHRVKCPGCAGDSSE